MAMLIAILFLCFLINCNKKAQLGCTFRSEITIVCRLEKRADAFFQ